MFEAEAGRVDGTEGGVEVAPRERQGRGWGLEVFGELGGLTGADVGGVEDGFYCAESGAREKNERPRMERVVLETG